MREEHVWVVMSASESRGGSPQGVFKEQEEAENFLKELPSPDAYAVRMEVGRQWRTYTEQVISK